MPVRAVDDKSSDTLVVVPGEGFWTGSSTLPHLHQYLSVWTGAPRVEREIRARRPYDAACPVDPEIAAEPAEIRPSLPKVAGPTTNRASR
jgi:hypothetical protein